MQICSTENEREKKCVILPLWYQCEVHLSEVIQVFFCFRLRRSSTIGAITNWAFPRTAQLFSTKICHKYVRSYSGEISCLVSFVSECLYLKNIPSTSMFWNVIVVILMGIFSLSRFFSCKVTGQSRLGAFPRAKSTKRSLVVIFSATFKSWSLLIRILVYLFKTEHLNVRKNVNRSHLRHPRSPGGNGLRHRIADRSQRLPWNRCERSGEEATDLTKES